MHVEAQVVIAASPDAVFAYVTVPENGPRWQQGAVRTSTTSSGPVGIGTRMDHVGRWLWMRIPTQAVVVEYERPRRYAYDITSALSKTPVHMRYLLDEVPGGTRLTLTNESRLAGPMRLLSPLLKRSVQRMFEGDIRRLKAVIEAEE